MNEFFLASNRSVKVQFLDVMVDVRQIQVKELDSIQEFAQPIKVSLGNKLDEEVIARTFKDNILHALTLCHTFSGVPYQIITDAFAKEYDQLIQLFSLILKINQAYFIDETVKRRKPSDKAATWFDSFQFLVQSGHSNESIMNMSYGAFLGYMKSANRSRNQSLITDANVVRVAQHAEKREFTKFIDGLKD